MIFKSFTFGCTILYLLSRARCENDASLQMEETNLTGSSGPGFVSIHEPYVDNDDIDHVKPLVNNVNVSARDYQKFRIEPHRSPRRINSVEGNVNVNVYHQDSSKPRWNKKQSKRLSHQLSSKQSENHENRLNRVMEMIHMIPNSNVDYNFANPYGDMSIRKRKYSDHKTVEHTLNNDSGQFVPIEEDDNQCQPIVHKALEYLRIVEVNLKNLERDLRSLVSEPQNVDSNEDYTEVELK